jgi:hypothetical protein
MSEVDYIILSILLLLAIGAIIFLIYSVVKKRRTRRAIIYARRILNAGQADSEEQFRTVYRRLATAGNDLEAAKIWQKLDELRDIVGIHPSR